jgi:hypothetical protein
VYQFNTCSVTFDTFPLKKHNNDDHEYGDEACDGIGKLSNMVKPSWTPVSSTLALLWLSASSVACAQGDWLTLAGEVGEPFNTQQNVVQVDPQTISESSGWRTMQIRVNRSEMRTSWDGVPYRSFTAAVEFDCTKRSARYLSLVYFMEPAWRGTSHETSVYTRERYRPVAFRQIHPNPTLRMVRAACDSKSVTSN